jgi:hypothetical protein
MRLVGINFHYNHPVDKIGNRYQQVIVESAAEHVQCLSFLTYEPPLHNGR